MDVNFSAFNLQYFLALRDISNDNPHVASAVFGTTLEFGNSLTRLKPQQLANLAYITVPLVVPRPEPIWWPRVFRALVDGDKPEFTALSEEAAYYLMNRTNKGSYKV